MESNLPSTNTRIKDHMQNYCDGLYEISDHYYRYSIVDIAGTISTVETPLVNKATKHTSNFKGLVSQKMTESTAISKIINFINKNPVVDLPGLHNLVCKKFTGEETYNHSDNYIYNWIDRCICLYKNKVFVNESELLDVWYDINFLGQAIDSCFYPLYEDLHFHSCWRGKRVLVSHSEDLVNNLKADLIIQDRMKNIEFAVMESCPPNNATYYKEVRLKIAKMLKDWIDNIAPYHEMISFIGIQSQGCNVSIYELKWEFKEAYSFIVLEEFELPKKLKYRREVELLLRFAASMLVLGDKFIQNVINIVESSDLAPKIISTTFNTPKKRAPDHYTNNANTKRNKLSLGTRTNYQVLQQTIGENSDIKLARNLFNGRSCLLKYCKNQDMGLLELNALSDLNTEKCHNIIPLLDYFYDNDTIVLVLPVFEDIKINSIKELRILIRDILQALAYVHKSGYVHLDIKPDNILFDTTNGTYILADFGLSLPVQWTSAYPVQGTDEYMSPEMKARDAVGTATDIYSLGIVMKSLLHRVSHEFNGFRSNLIELLRVYAIDLCEKMLEKRQDKRVSAKEALQHYFFSNKLS